MINCIFRGNKGGIESDNNLALYGCVITNNSYGVRMNSYGSISKLVNCTIASNTDFGVAAQKDTDMYNCLVWNNSIVEKLYGSSDGIITRYACKEVVSVDNSAVRLTHPSPTKGEAASDWRTADWSLSAGSTCINAGVDLYFPISEVATDVAGNPRIIGTSIDVGAYEY